MNGSKAVSKCSMRGGSVQQSRLRTTNRLLNTLSRYNTGCVFDTLKAPAPPRFRRTLIRVSSVLLEHAEDIYKGL